MIKAEDSTESSTEEASRHLVSAGGSGALALVFLLKQKQTTKNKYTCFKNNLLMRSHLIKTQNVCMLLHIQEKCAKILQLLAY